MTVSARDEADLVLWRTTSTRHEGYLNPDPDGITLAGVTLGEEDIPAHYLRDGLVRKWGLERREPTGEGGLGFTYRLTGKEIHLLPNRWAAYIDFNKVPEGEQVKPQMIFRCEEGEWPKSPFTDSTSSQPTEEQK